MKTLETARLIIRPFRIDDLNDLYEYAKVEGVGEKAGWKHHTSITESNIILQNFIASDEVYALELKESHKVIGSIGLHIINNDKLERELGYVLSKDYHNLGIMSEATKEVIRFAFEDMRIKTLWCMHFEDNLISKRIILKNGFKYHHTFMKDIEALDFKRFKVYAYYMDKDIYDSRTH
ncbi:MAG: GNAT family N-acetyltransferase [Bacilli bacterium]|nr:GNAT family N-acetyltransferase [Bacilli bacterium]